MENNEKLCKSCKKDISNRPTQARFCSLRCAWDFRLATLPKPQECECRNCKIKFIPNSRRKQLYCSYACMYLYHLNQGKVALVEKACEHCGEFFMPVRAFHIYCKPACKKAHLIMAYKIGVDIKEMNALKDPIDDELKRIEEAKGIAALKPPPGFEQPAPISDIPMKKSIKKDLDIPYDDSPEEARPFCDHCGTRKTVSLIESLCAECFAEVQKEEAK